MDGIVDEEWAIFIKVREVRWGKNYYAVIIKESTLSVLCRFLCYHRAKRHRGWVTMFHVAIVEDKESERVRIRECLSCFEETEEFVQLILAAFQMLCIT